MADNSPGWSVEPFMATAIIALLLGGISGVAAALCGVGGGVFLVPAFVFCLGLDQKKAVATSLAVIVLTSIVATIRNAGNMLVDWKIAIWTAVGSGVVVWFAAEGLKRLSNLTLTRLFAVFVILMGLYMFIRSLRDRPPDAPTGVRLVERKLRE